MTAKIPMGLKGFRAEPVAVAALVGAILFALVEFGVPVTEGQQKAIQAVIGAALAFLVRSQVISESTVREAGMKGEELVGVLSQAARREDLQVRAVRVLPASAYTSPAPGAFTAEAARGRRK